MVFQICRFEPDQKYIFIYDLGFCKYINQIIFLNAKGVSF